MYKTELIQHIAAQTGLTKDQAKRALNAFTDTVETTLQQGGRVTLLGFGSFKVSYRPARNGVHPGTQKPMRLPAKKIPIFKAGKGLKNALE